MGEKLNRQRAGNAHLRWGEDQIAKVFKQGGDEFEGKVNDEKSA